MRRSKILLFATATIPLALVLVGQASAQAPEGKEEPAQAQPADASASAQAAALAKQLSNPVASLVSVPFQMNWDGGIGPDEDTRFIMNFQPVMPFRMSEKLNLIARVIVPYVGQAASGPGGAAPSGISDILFSAFFSPAQPRGAIWGVGPVFQLPTTSDPALGTEKWGFGPTFLILKQSGPWTYGMLANQVWSFAGDEDRTDVNQTYLQPFLSYGTKSAVTFGVNSESAANWEASDGEEWTVPINFTISKVAKIGKKPISLGTGVGVYADQPTGGPEWKFRTVVTLLFPAK